MSQITEPSETITSSDASTANTSSVQMQTPFPPLQNQLPSRYLQPDASRHFNRNDIIVINHVNPPRPKKRGRPRLFGSDYFSRQQSVDPSATLQNVTPLPQHEKNVLPSHDVSPVKQLINFMPPASRSASPVPKKLRGHNEVPKSDDAAASPITLLTPHNLGMQEREDITEKIMTFFPNGSRAVCVLSATGVISNAALSQAATPDTISYYEGKFNILSLSGSFVISEVDGQTSKTGGLTVTLVGADGKIFGGRVSGALIAASPVQVMLGSFKPGGHSEHESESM